MRKILPIIIILVIVIVVGFLAVKFFGGKLTGPMAGKSITDLAEEQGEKEKKGEEQPGEGPISDVPGKDLPDVPRYPGSVRSMYGTIPGFPDAGFYIMYDAPGSAKEVKDFYEAQLPANGWKSSVTAEEAEELWKYYESSYRFIEQELTKGKQTIVVQVGLSGSDYPGYTDVIITLPSNPFQ